MNFGSTKTKLDYIVERGLQRMDEAVEAVISRHSTDIIDEDKYDQYITECMVDMLDAEDERVAQRARNYDSTRILDQMVMRQSAILNNQSALGGLRSGAGSWPGDVFAQLTGL